MFSPAARSTGSSGLAGRAKAQQRSRSVKIREKPFLVKIEILIGVKKDRSGDVGSEVGLDGG